MIRTERRGRIFEIVLDHPPLNILTMAVLRSLQDALTRIGDARVVLIRGEGKCFSGGADVREHLPEHAEAMIEAFHGTLAAIASLPVPTAAAVHGSALGGGLELAIACDLTFVTEGARLQLPEIRLGCIAPFAAALLPAEVGQKRAMEILLSGEPIADPRGIGLVNDVLPAGGFLDAVRARLEPIAANSRAALAACRKAVRRAADADEPLRRAERVYVEDAIPTADYREGITAFLEKRAPVWKDR